MFSLPIPLAAALGLGAAALQVLSYTIYLRLTLDGRCRPNGISWLMWSYGTAVLLVVEAGVGTPVSVMLAPAFCLVCSCIVTAWAMRDGSGDRPAASDFAALAIDVAILATYVAAMHGGERAGREAEVWLVLLPAASSIVSAWPTLVSTWRAPGRERPLSWLLSAGADMLVALAVLAEGLEWQYLVYPLVTLTTQVGIAVLAMPGLRSPQIS